MNEIAILYSLIIILFLCGITPLIRSLRTLNRDIFEPIYWASAYFLFVFGVRSIYALIFGTGFLGEPPFPSETLNAWIAALGLAIYSFLAFLIGYYSQIGVAVAKTLPLLPKRWSNLKVKIAIPMLLGAGLVSLVFLAEAYGGWQVFLTSEKQELLTAAGVAYLCQLSNMILYALIVAYIAHLYRRVSLIVVAVLFLISFMVGIGFGSKALVFMPLLTIFIARHYLKSNLKMKPLLVFVAVVVLSFPFFNLLRHSSDLSFVLSQGWSMLVNKPSVLLSHIMNRFHGIDSLIFIVRDTPEVMDFQLGRTIAPVFVAWIPRILWPEKPTVSFGRLFGETYYAGWFAGTGTAASPTIIGEAYLNFHIGGVLWIGLIGGIMVRSFYYYLIKRNFGPSGIFLFAIMSQFLLGGFWEADIVGLITRAGFSLLLGVTIVILLSRKKRLRP